MTRRIATAAAVALASCTPTPTPPAPVVTTAPTTTSTTTTTLAPTTTTHTHPPRAARRRVPVSLPEGNAGAMEQQLAAIARCESGGRYDAENPRSTASGKYQALDSTWDGYGGYQRASDAPPEVQEAWAREAYARSGTRPWRASRGCWAGAA